MNVYELGVKLFLDSSEVDKGLPSVGDKVSKFGASLAKGLKTVAKVSGVALGAASTALVGIGKQSIQAYAKYEQLVGGVDTLFKRSELSLEEYAAATGRSVGEVVAEYNQMNAAADLVMKNASEAYETAGMSANDYLETVTGMSAALIQSLDGDTTAAAEYADMAIRDMSDNANKMGTSMESIQNAYSGFAKGNYTMLDNLKLGYGGTKTEMERLIKDAERLNKNFKATRDSNGDLTMSYADIVDAIHIVQENMGINGATAEEASTTIEGSVNSMKAAWDNLLVGMADDNADMDTLITNFLDSVSTVGDNILPRVEKAVNGVSTLISVGAEKIVPLISEVISNNIGTLISAGAKLLVALITGIIGAIPDLVKEIPGIVTAIKDAFIENKDDLKDAGIEMLEMIGEGAWEAIKWAAKVGTQIVDDIKQGISDKWDSLKQWFQNLFDGLFGGLSANIDVAANYDRSSYPGHASGLDYVPHDDYVARLHTGEAVLTRVEAEAWRNGGGGESADVDRIVDLLETIVSNGLNANISRTQLYSAVQGENQKRSRATNYNGLALT